MEQVAILNEEGNQYFGIFLFNLTFKATNAKWNFHLSRSYTFNFRKVTICDLLERCIRRGKGEEAGAAAIAAAALTLSLGESLDDAEEIYTTLAPSTH